MTVIGLTGSIGMGKSTTAQIFREQGVPVWDADQAVKDLYNTAEFIQSFAKSFPQSVVNGKIIRTVLRETLQKNPESFQTLEALVHPKIAKLRQEFLDLYKDKVVVLDVPLLFETGLFQTVDKIVVVTIDAEEQRKRVLNRGEMTEEQFAQILQKQIPDAQKRSRADYVIETVSIEAVQTQVSDILKEIRNA